VTLDELKPLLDHIGGEGVHIEMDFHNEREVEQAMRIVEEYQSKDEDDRKVEEIIRLTENKTRQTRISIDEIAKNRILVLDGAMGTMIQQVHHGEGCNDMLVLTKPDIISDIHRKYLEAGADLIETNTFNAQRISMLDYGLSDKCRDINLAAAKIARQLADEYTAKTPEKPRLVLGSIGPTSRTTSVATSGEPLDESLLEAAYIEQIQALSDGGVDALLIETIFDVRNAEIAIKAARETAPSLPIMLSFSVSTPDGHNMLGQSIIEFISALNRDDIFSIGINCLSDVPKMTPLICQLASFGLKVSLYPNAGMPDSNGHYQKSPESLVADLWPLLENHCLNIVGGCCGTTDAHIRQMAKAVEPMPGLYLSPLSPKEASPAISFPSSKSSLSSQSSPSRAAIPANISSDRPEERLFQAILNGKSDEAAAATREAIAQSVAPQDLINGQMIRAMGEVGQRFQDGKAFVPQLLMAGRAMKAALELLKPLLAGTTTTSLGKVVIGTVKGDLHDIGKNLVASMLEGCGFEVVNIGIDVSADAFIQAVRENQPDILCMSALLTTTMGYMKEVIDALEAAGIRNQVKVMVGGAPVTQGYADEIGADGYSDNANSAVTVAKQLLGKL